MRAARVACAAGLVVAVIAIDLAGHHPNHTPKPKPKPAPSVTAASADWADRIQDAIDQLTSAQTAIGTPTSTGQNLGQFHKDCATAVARYNATAAEAGTYWPAYIPHPLDPSKECTP